MFSKELTESEKIDFIYKELKAQAKWRYIKSWIKLLFLWFIIYFYVIILPTINPKNIIDSFAWRVAPLSKWIMNNMIENMDSNIDPSIIEKLKNTIWK